MSTTLRMAMPGWDWLPPALRSARYWRVVGRFALWGPLIGGAPYAVFVVTVPLVYLVGLVPAAVTGMMFGAWLLAPGRRYPSAAWRAALGMLCALLACAAIAWAIDRREPQALWLMLALHGVPAALVLALTQKPAVR